jgi:parallel beta-helix repeat protein
MRSHSLTLSVLLLFAAGCETGDRAVDVPADIPSAAAGVVPTEVECGASVAADLKLGNDLVCTGDAFFVTADDVTIDLNGHTISGSATGVGITVRMRHGVTIHGGTIQNFLTGIFVSQSSNVDIRENRLAQNREAIFLIGSSNNIVRENVAWENQLRGVMLRPTTGGIPSTGNLVAENTLHDNPSGILVFAQSGNTITENWIRGSSVAALDLTGPTGGSGNLFGENRLETSAAAVRFGPGWAGNTFAENRMTSNVCALSGASGGNTFTENSFVANGSDVC